MPWPSMACFPGSFPVFTRVIGPGHWASYSGEYRIFSLPFFNNSRSHLFLGLQPCFYLPAHLLCMHRSPERVRDPLSPDYSANRDIYLSLPDHQQYLDEYPLRLPCPPCRYSRVCILLTKGGHSSPQGNVSIGRIDIYPEN